MEFLRLFENEDDESAERCPECSEGGPHEFEYDSSQRSGKYAADTYACKWCGKKRQGEPYDDGDDD